MAEIVQLPTPDYLAIARGYLSELRKQIETLRGHSMMGIYLDAKQVLKHANEMESNLSAVENRLKRLKRRET